VYKGEKGHGEAKKRRALLYKREKKKAVVKKYNVTSRKRNPKTRRGEETVEYEVLRWDVGKRERVRKNSHGPKKNKAVRLKGISHTEDKWRGGNAHGVRKRKNDDNDVGTCTHKRKRTPTTNQKP